MKKSRQIPQENWSHKHDVPENEIWGTYHYIAADILPRLRAFKSYNKKGYPCFRINNMSDWNKVIQKMIDAFELLSVQKPYMEHDRPIIEEGLDLFRQYFVSLWC